MGLINVSEEKNVEEKGDFVESCSYLGIFTVKVVFAEEKKLEFVVKKK